jgi:hypothetical protein
LDFASVPKAKLGRRGRERSNSTERGSAIHPSHGEQAPQLLAAPWSSPMPPDAAGYQTSLTHLNADPVRSTRPSPGKGMW